MANPFFQKNHCALRLSSTYKSPKAYQGILYVPLNPSSPHSSRRSILILFSFMATLVLGPKQLTNPLLLPRKNHFRSISCLGKFTFFSLHLDHRLIRFSKYIVVKGTMKKFKLIQSHKMMKKKELKKSIYLRRLAPFRVQKTK